MHRIITSLALSYLCAFTSLASIIDSDLEKDFQARLPVIEKVTGQEIWQSRLNGDQLTALKMLYAYMPLPDMTDRTPEYYLDFVVNPALEARRKMPWGSEISDTLFFHFVLPVRVNNEALDMHRPEFYAALKDRVNGLSMKEAILEVNHWCHEKATYQPSDARTHSPLQTLRSAIGRCGEESTFTVAALRSVGIPARQVYTPRWAHTDDNHAWVEAWADGKWHFLGACEPEPVLDLGWFNAPASRGMLMHARVFGNYSGSEEQLEKIDGITFINVTSNYAPVDTVSVSAFYPAGPDGTQSPAADARVAFRLYNYAEFYPIAEKKTDSDGNVSLIAGLGDLLVWVSDGERFGFSKASVGKDKNVTVVLDKTAATPFSIDLDIIPPKGSETSVIVSDSLRKVNDMRLKDEDAIRNAYMATFASDSTATLLSLELKLNEASLRDILKKSRGNHGVIAEFLRTLPAHDREKGLLLLQSVSEKDLSDVTSKILADHIRAVDFGASPLFGQYVLSPRIDNEELTPYRSFFDSVFSTVEAYRYRSNPSEWISWISANIKADQKWYPQQIAMSPEAVWKIRHTSPESRDIFFVAGARSMGIPARIDPVTGKPQWAGKDGKWIDAIFLEDTDNAGAVDAQQGALKFLYAPSPIIPDPKYYSHFTVSKIENGQPELLNYPDFIGLSETFETGEKLDRGSYLLTTGQRMADGGVLAHLESIVLDADSIVLPFSIRHDESKVQVIGSFDSESRYLPDGASDPVSILSTTGRGYYVLAILKSNHEPSNHAIRDISEAASRLEAAGRNIIFLTEGNDSEFDHKDFPPLPDVVSLGSDYDGAILKSIMQEMNLSSPDLPLIIIADTFNRVVFISQGYTIGIGHKLADILSRL